MIADIQCHHCRHDNGIDFNTLRYGIPHECLGCGKDFTPTVDEKVAVILGYIIEVNE